MRLIISINMDNAAFRDAEPPNNEVSYLLNKVETWASNMPPLKLGDDYSIRDVNGNTVGFALVEED